MAGYTDAAMRSLCLEMGAGAVYTELTSAEGIRRESEKTFQVLETGQAEHPIAGHIFGRDPDAMADAARYIEQTGQFDWIDLNCGCPVKKVVSRGAGAALLKELPLLGKIVETVKAAVSLPVSVKTRIGFNHETASHLEIARVVEQSGADLIAVHARLAKYFHGGDPDWEKLAEMRQHLSIPLLGNGGILTPEDAENMLRIGQVDGIMIGRGAIGNPWIFADLKAGLPGSPRSVMERRNRMAEHLNRLVQLNTLKQAGSSLDYRYTPEQMACIQFRTHIPYYVKGLFAKKQLLMKLSQLISVDAIMQEIDRLAEKNSQRTDTN
jgi:tRNA-dihydrouridine synthase B